MEPRAHGGCDVEQKAALCWQVLGMLSRVRRYDVDNTAWIQTLTRGMLHALHQIASAVPTTGCLAELPSRASGINAPSTLI